MFAPLVEAILMSLLVGGIIGWAIGVSIRGR